MARYAISPEGAAALNALANNLLISANNIIESSASLEATIAGNADGLGIYGDEVLSLVARNKQLLHKNRDSIVDLAVRVKEESENVAQMCSLNLHDQLPANTTVARASNGSQNDALSIFSPVVISKSSVGADGEKHDYRTIINYSDKAENIPTPFCFGCDSERIQKWGKRHYSKWISSLSKQEKAAIENYTGEGSNSYRTINTNLRTGIPLNVHDAELVNSIHSALSRASLPHDVQVYRALDENGIRELALYCNQGNIEEGASLQDSAFMSCSLLANNSFNTDRSNNYILRLAVPEGVHAAYVNKVSSFSVEQELLIDKDHCLYITGVSKCARKEITQNSWDSDTITVIDGVLSF